MSRESQSLAGRRIVVTRAREQAGDLVAALTARGAQVISAPAIRIEPLSDTDALRAAVTNLTQYHWLVFTSQNTVRVVHDRLAEWSLPASTLARVPIAAIGPATAHALEAHGVRPAVVPERFIAEAVVDAILERGPVRGQRILLPRALEARDTLPEGLRAQGAVVDVIPVYRAVAESGDGTALAADLLAGRIDAVTFTASSTVRAFVDQVGREAATCDRFATAVIGPITAQTARELGMPVVIEADEYTGPGLVRALVHYFGPPGAAPRGEPKGKK
ncbi:MAG TPA: uroporphyrinogen-III synthase [Gemmatimonadales bacterium]|nr:uroporphyrinogen-III synthase [Gemmatimonadales bacterium]